MSNLIDFSSLLLERRERCLVGFGRDKSTTTRQDKTSFEEEEDEGEATDGTKCVNSIRNSVAPNVLIRVIILHFFVLFVSEMITIPSNHLERSKQTDSRTNKQTTSHLSTCFFRLSLALSQVSNTLRGLFSSSSPHFPFKSI